MSDRLDKRDWMVLDVPHHAEATELVRRSHYAKGASNTSTYRHGLYRSGVLRGELFGVAMWMPPTKNAALSVSANWQGVLCLSRLVVLPEVPSNGASYLLGSSMRMIDRNRWPVLLTYADTNQGHTGAIYKATNWKCLGQVPAGDTWVDAKGTQRGRKRGGRTLLVQEMRDMGFSKVKSAPKIKFVHGEGE